MPIGVIETWESAPTHCTDEAVGRLERGPVVNDYLGRGRLKGTHIDFGLTRFPSNLPQAHM